MEIFLSQRPGGSVWLIANNPDLALHPALIRAGFKKSKSKNLWYRPRHGFAGFWRTKLVPQDRLLWPEFGDEGPDIKLALAQSKAGLVLVASGADADQLEDLGFQRLPSGIYTRPSRQLGQLLLDILQRFEHTRLHLLPIDQVPRYRKSSNSAIWGEWKDQYRKRFDRTLVDINQIEIQEHEHQEAIKNAELFFVNVCAYKIQIQSAYEILKSVRDDTPLPDDSEFYERQSKTLVEAAKSFDLDDMEASLDVIKQRYVQHHVRHRVRQKANMNLDSGFAQMLWDTAKQLGFSGGRVLIPDIGSGTLLDHRPKDCPMEVLGFEPVPMLAKICRLKHPGVEIIESEPDETPLFGAENQFDLLIGGFDQDDAFSYDPAFPYPVSNVERRVLRCLRYLKPNGLAVINVQTALMDQIPSYVRRQIARHCQLVCAGRFSLHNTFHYFPGYGLATNGCDVLVLRKRPHPVLDVESEPWIEARPIRKTYHLLARQKEQNQGQPDPNFQKFYNVYQNVLFPRDIGATELTLKAKEQDWIINEYFLTFPNAVFSRPEVDGSKRRLAIGYMAELRAQKAFQNFSQFVSQVAASSNAAPDTDDNPDDALDIGNNPEDSLFPAPLTLAPGCFELGADGLQVRQLDGSLVPVSLRNKSQIAILSDMVPLRDAVIEVLNLEMDSDTAPEVLEKARDQLRSTYQAFVSKHDRLLSDTNRAVINRDPMGYLVLALEKVETVNGQEQIVESEILSGRVLQTPGDPPRLSENEAVAASIGRFGEVRLDWVADCIGATSSEEAAARLVQTKAAFIDPETETWIDGLSYLSGNVRAKLEVALAAAKENPLFIPNAEALEEALPAWVPFHQIDVDPAAPYVPPDLLGDFIVEKCQIRRGSSWRESLAYNRATGMWEFDGIVGGNGQYTTSERSLEDILHCVLNQKSATVTSGGKVLYTETMAVQKKIQDFKRDFRDWLAQDPERRERIEQSYNESINCHVHKHFHQVPDIPLDRSAALFRFRPNQNRGLYRILTEPATLICHEMGGGKTALALGAAIKLKQIRPQRCNVIVFPENIIDRAMIEAATFFPGGRFLFPTGNDLQKKGLQDYLAKIKAEGHRYDAVVMTQTMFKNIPLRQGRLDSDAVFRHTMLSHQYSCGRMHVIGESNLLEFVRMHKKLADALPPALAVDGGKANNKATEICLEDLNVGALLYDEIHLAKKIPLKTRRNVLGLPQGDAAIATDLLAKLDYLRHIGAKIVGFTGTPINNSVAEIYINKRLIAPSVLYQAGIFNFDTWANLFADTEIVIEKSPSGDGYRTVERFCKIRNAVEMMEAFGAFADIAFLKQIGVTMPEQEDHTVMVPRSPMLGLYMQTLSARAKRLSKETPENDNILVIMNNGYAASQDLSLALRIPPLPGAGKMDRAVAQIYQEWQATRNDRLTQMVFLDIGTSGNRNCALFDEIRDRLVALGVPRDEILLSSDWGRLSGQKKVTARAAALQRFRSGSASILIGTTAAIGVGLDAPDRVSAIHLIDPTWRPDQMEQRIRRGVRPGNHNQTVKVFYYIQKNSMDEYYWQTLQRKAAFIRAMLNYDRNARHLEEKNQIPYEELLALASENPLIKEKHQIDNQIAYLEACLKDHENNVQRSKQQVELLNDKIEAERKRLDKCKQIRDIAQNWGQDPQKLDLLVEAGKKLAVILKKQYQTETNLGPGIRWRFPSVSIEKHLLISEHHFIRAARSPKKMAQLLKNRANHFQGLIRQDATRLCSLEARVDDLQQLINQDVAQMKQELADLYQRKNDVDTRLLLLEKKDKSATAGASLPVIEQRLRSKSKAMSLALQMAK